MTSTGEDTGSTATRTGSWRRAFTRSMTSGGMVAEKKRVCFFLRQELQDPGGRHG